MLRIVTGKINSGKTTSIYNIFNENKIGDGFISIKNMCCEGVHSYDILRLTSNETKKFIVHDKFFESNEPVIYKIGPYNVLKNAFNKVVKELRLMIKEKVSPIYLDEIGLLELKDEGFSQIFKELLDSNLEIFVVIRKELIDQIVKKYNIKDYEIVT